MMTEANPSTEGTQQVRTTVGPLPIVQASVSPEEVMLRLDGAARKGKMPGLRGGQAGGFELTDFGAPFESVLVARVTAAGGGGATIEFQRRLRPLWPWIYGAVLVATIWPGMWLTDSMLQTYFEWYQNIKTWWWYLPLTLPTLPWAWMTAMKRSRESGEQEARALIERVRALVGG